MDETTLKILNDRELVDYHDNWCRVMRDIFEGNETGPVVLHGIVGRRSDSELLYNDPRQALCEDMEVLAKSKISINIFVLWEMV